MPHIGVHGLRFLAAKIIINKMKKDDFDWSRSANFIICKSKEFQKCRFLELSCFFKAGFVFFLCLAGRSLRRHFLRALKFGGPLGHGSGVDRNGRREVPKALDGLRVFDSNSNNHEQLTTLIVVEKGANFKI